MLANPTPEFYLVQWYQDAYRPQNKKTHLWGSPTKFPAWHERSDIPSWNRATECTPLGSRYFSPARLAFIDYSLTLLHSLAIRKTVRCLHGRHPYGRTYNVTEELRVHTLCHTQTHFVLTSSSSWHFRYNNLETWNRIETLFHYDTPKVDKIFCAESVSPPILITPLSLKRENEVGTTVAEEEVTGYIGFMDSIMGLHATVTYVDPLQFER